MILTRIPSSTFPSHSPDTNNSPERTMPIALTIHIASMPASNRTLECPLLAWFQTKQDDVVSEILMPLRQILERLSSAYLP